MQEADMIRIEGARFVRTDDGLACHERAQRKVNNVCRLISELESRITAAEAEGSIAYVDAHAIHDVLCRAVWHEDWIEEFNEEVSK